MYTEIAVDSIMDWDLKGWLSGICFHQGRTDHNYGHRDWLNRCGWGIGSYHYHHGLSAHLHPNGVCPYLKQTFIINPYTGKTISLGQPYIFQNDEYYSLNLVSKALTADDTMGVTLNSKNTGGAFYACSTGYFNTLGLGEELAFTYPKILIVLNNNTLFHAENEELKLLCYTKKSAFDDIDCYAYINLKTIGAYMTKDGYFTDFLDNRAGVWSFKSSSEASEFGVAITNPKSNASFTVGDSMIVEVGKV